MSMKNLFLALLFTLIPILASAQNQGDPTPLGSGGVKIFCNSNAALTATVSGDGKLNFVGCTTAGALLVNLTAGTADIGSLIGNTVTLTSTLTVTATAYEALDLVGGKNTLSGAVRASAGSGVIQSVVIADQAAQAGSYDVVYWSADPSGTTFTDEAALDIADADLLKIICVIPVTTTATFNDNGVSASNNAGCAFEVPSGTSIYMAVVARSTPTFAANTDVQVRTTILQD